MLDNASSVLACIEGVRPVLNPNPMPPGLFQYSAQCRCLYCDNEFIGVHAN
jgi:hypothetical protein